MREEYELEVLEKYDIEVKSTRRIRGAFFCIGSELKSGRVGDFGDCLQSREESATFVSNRTLYGRRQNLPFCIKIWKNWL